ncbi:hypothetical protein CsSME_00014040 [Camellia sinensis var. sinensis]
MGKYLSWVNTPEGMAWFRKEYNILEDVTLTLASPGTKRKNTKNMTALTIACIVEGGVRFPLNSLLRRFLHHIELTSTQISTNSFRVLSGVCALNQRLGLSLDIWDIVRCYYMSHSSGAIYYICVWSLAYQLVTDLPNANKYGDDFFLVGGNWEFPFGTEHRTELVLRVSGCPGKCCFKRRKTLENRKAIKIALSYEKHSPSKLLGYEPTYKSTIQQKSILITCLREWPKSDVEIEVEQVGTSASTAQASSQFESSKGYSPSSSSTSEGEDMLRNGVLLDLQAVILGTDLFPIEVTDPPPTKRL